MRGRDEEFVEFVREASPRLLKSAWFICGDPVQAEELVQAALEKVYVRWHRLRDGDPLAYTRRCLLNAHIDERRRVARERPSDELPEQHHHDRSPDEAQRLVGALSTLPLRERQVVVMRHYAGLPEAQVAELLGVSLGTVKSSASRGLAKLREIVAREETSHVR